MSESAKIVENYAELVKQAVHVEYTEHGELVDHTVSEYVTQ